LDGEAAMRDLTVKQVAARLEVGKSTVNYWINQGHFPSAYKLNPYARNSPLRVPEKDVAQFEAKRRGK
jgi:predicted DNA-binding transcriptional regulator AlpA